MTERVRRNCWRVRRRSVTRHGIDAEPRCLTSFEPSKGKAEGQHQEVGLCFSTTCWDPKKIHIVPRRRVRIGHGLKGLEGERQLEAPPRELPTSFPRLGHPNGPVRKPEGFPAVFVRVQKVQPTAHRVEGVTSA